MATARWSSMRMSFFWYDASSPVERFRARRTTWVLLRRPTAAEPVRAHQFEFYEELMIAAHPA